MRSFGKASLESLARASPMRSAPRWIGAGWLNGNSYA